MHALWVSTCLQVRARVRQACALQELQVRCQLFPGLQKEPGLLLEGWAVNPNPASQHPPSRKFLQGQCPQAGCTAPPGAEHPVLALSSCWGHNSGSPVHLEETSFPQG